MTYVDVWRLETAWDEDVNDEWYEFGLVSPDNKRPVNESAQVDVIELESIGNTPTLITGNKPNTRTTIKCQAVNAEPFKWMLGNDEGAGVWSAITTGNKPSIAVYKKDDYLTYRARGVKLQQLDWKLEIAAGGLLEYIMSGIGGTHGAYTFPAWNGATAYIADDYCMSGGIVYKCILGHTNHIPPNITYWTSSLYKSSLQTPLGFMSTFTWIAASYEVMMMSGTIQQTLTPLIGPDGYYQVIADNSSMHFTLTVMFKAAQDVSVISADRWLGTEQSFEIKMYKPNDVAHYIKLSGTGICRDMMVSSAQGLPTVYTGIFVLNGDTEMTDVLT